MSPIVHGANCQVTLNGKPITVFEASAVEFQPVVRAPESLAPIRVNARGQIEIRLTKQEFNRLIDNSAPSKYWLRRWQFKRKQARKNWWKFLLQ